MRFLVDTKPGKNLQGDTMRYRVTNLYIEFEIPIDDSYMVFYLIPRNDYSAFIATCWDFTFDQVVSQLDDEDYQEVVAETWKNFARLLTNGINDYYSQGALIRNEDFDTGETKWFLTSIVGNLDFSNLSSVDDLLTDDVQTVMNFVIDQSIELMKELSEKQPSVLSVVAKGVSRGFWEGVGLVAAGGIVAMLGGDPSELWSDY